MSLWKWLPGQLAEQGRSPAQIGSNRFSRITAKTLWHTQGRCEFRFQAMQSHHRPSLPQRSPGAGQSKPWQSVLNTTGFHPYWLKQLQGFSCIPSHGPGRMVLQQYRLTSPTRAVLLNASRSSSTMGLLTPIQQAVACSNHLWHPHSLLQLQKRQPSRMPSLRAMLTSDAATRKHLPQHLQDAYQRKQTSPRSNAAYSAVAQAEEDYQASHMSQQQLAELPQQRSSSNAQQGASVTETGAHQALAEGATEGLANEEQVQRLEGALAVASALVEGTIQNVTYKNVDSGYTVLKVAALHTAGEPPEQRSNAAQMPSRGVKGGDPKNIVTVVGNLPHAAKGQQLRFVGDWVLHPKHSWQLKATAYEEVVPRSPQAVAAYLASTIDGVGYATATRLVMKFGTSVLALLDAPNCVQALSGVENIGPTRAANIKQLWDASRELREMRQFVKTLGLTGRLAHMLVERHGKHTEARLKQDPYSCLHGMPGVTFRVAEDLAWAVNAPTDLPSRGATAFLHTLQLASEKAGHTHLPWEVLIMHTQRLLSSSGRPWADAERLKDIAQHLQKAGHIVVESPDTELQTVPKPKGHELPALPQIFGGSMWGGASDGLVGSSSNSGDSLQDHLQRESLERYLTSRIQGVGPNRAKQLVGLHGVGIVQQLDGDAEAALKALTQIRGVGRKTAEQMLRSWAQNAKRAGPWKDPSAGLEQGAEASQSSESAFAASESDLQWPWDPQSRCYLADMHDTEVRVAAALSRIAAQEEQCFDGGEERVINWDKARREKERKEEGKESPLSEGQKAAVMRASRAPLIVLTGGPGCGKTFATKAIVQLWQSQQKDIRLAAPTGRAAERLQAESNKRGPRAQIKATTIHRLLNYRSWSQRRQGQEKDSSEGGDDLEGFFAFNAQRTLEAPSGKLSILVDETSMLDMALASSLLEAIPTDVPVQLVLVGDADQLPPVSSGSFLSAAIDSGVVPVVDLREVFRQAQGSDIVKAAHAVHAGRMPSLTRIDSAHPSEESKERQALWVIPHSLADIENEVVRTVQSRIMTDRGVDVKQDLQVLTPMRKGPAGVQSLNARLQALLNPPEKGKGQIRVSSAADTPQILRVGDRVIQAVNNYDKEVFNGDPGYVVSVDAAARRIKVQYSSSGAESGTGREVEYSGAELWEVELAWATTVHKAQGSESKAVIVVLSPAHRPLLTRRLFYTAITRAREAVVVVGAEAAMRTALQGTQGDVRLSSLHNRLAAAAERLNLPRCTPVVYRRPVADGQGFAAAGPVGDAVSQKVSDSVHQAQEEQHLDDLAASTRQRQEAVQELTSSSAVYNNGSSAAAPAQHAECGASGHLTGTNVSPAGHRIPPHQEEAVPSSSSSSDSDPTAGGFSQQGLQGGFGSGDQATAAPPGPAWHQAEQSTRSVDSSDPRRSNAPQHLGSLPRMGAKKASSLQGSRQPRGRQPNSTQS